MQARKLYLVLILTLVLSAFAPAQSERNNAQSASAPDNVQNANPRPNSHAEGATSTSNPQSPTARRLTHSAVPSDFLYETLFDNMAMLDRIAEQDDRQGKHEMAARWRTHDQRAAGLNETEGEILKEVALDCHQAVQEQNAKIIALLQKLDAQRVPGVKVQPSPELVQLNQDRTAIIEAHIEKLREALGEGSFAKLDHYVRSTFHAETTKPSQQPSSTPANGKKENQ
jgi:hypothetical protein